MHSNPSIKDYAGNHTSQKQAAQQQAPKSNVNTISGGTAYIPTGMPTMSLPTPPPKYVNSAVNKVRLTAFMNMGYCLQFDTVLSVSCSQITAIRKEAASLYHLRIYSFCPALPGGYFGILANNQADLDNLYERVQYVLTHGGEA